MRYISEILYTKTDCSKSRSSLLASVQLTVGVCYGFVQRNSFLHLAFSLYLSTKEDRQDESFYSFVRDSPNRSSKT